MIPGAGEWGAAGRKWSERGGVGVGPEGQPPTPGAQSGEEREMRPLPTVLRKRHLAQSPPAPLPPRKRSGPCPLVPFKGPETVPG